MIDKNGLLVLLGIVALLLLVNACSNLRKLTYPENFAYTEKKEPNVTMQRVSVILSKLDKAMAEVLTVQQGQSQILLQLEALDLICAELE